MRRMSAGVSAAALAIALAAPAAAQVTPGSGQQGGIATTPGPTGTLPGQQPLPGDIGSGGLGGIDTAPPDSVTGQQVDPTIPDVDDGSPGLAPSPGLGTPGIGDGGTEAPGAIGTPTPGTTGSAPGGISTDIPGAQQDPTLGGIAPGVGTAQPGADADEAPVPGESPVLGAEEPLDGTTPGLEGDLGAADPDAAGGIGPDLGADRPGAPGEPPLATGDGTGFGAGPAGGEAPETADGETGPRIEEVGPEGAEAEGAEADGAAPAPEVVTGGADSAGTPPAAAIQQDGAAGDAEGAAAPEAAETADPEAPVAGEDAAAEGAAPATGLDAADDALPEAAGQSEADRFAMMDALHETLGALGAEDRTPFAGQVMRGTAPGGAPVLILVGAEDFAETGAAAMAGTGMGLEQALSDAGLETLAPDMDTPIMRAAWEDHVVFAMPAERTAPGIAGHDAAGAMTGAEGGDADGLEDALVEAGIEPEDGFEPVVFRAVQGDVPVLLVFTGAEASGGVDIEGDALRERLEEAGLSEVERLDEDLHFVRGNREGEGVLALGGEALGQNGDAELAPN